jgi:asparaginyl-tRNA synthetase
MKDNNYLEKLHRLKMRRTRCILKVRSQVFHSVRSFLWEEGFTEIHAPVISSATDTSTPFKTVFYGKELLLPTSYQLYKQAALNAFDKVYILQPAFRREKGGTNIHLSEFWMLDMELAEATCDRVMNVSEELISRVCEDVINHCKEELEYLKRELHVPKTPFPRFTHHEILRIINKLLKMKLTTSDSISCDTMKKLSKNFDTPFWIHDWSIETVKEWYYLQDPENPKVLRFFELYYPEGFEEGISGGERECRVSEIERKLTAMNRDTKDYQWYIEMFREGMPRHAGCGLGVDRLVMWLCGVEDIIETTLFPRTVSDWIP